jgi:hypothetical protein
VRVIASSFSSKGSWIALDFEKTLAAAAYPGKLAPLAKAFTRKLSNAPFDVSPGVDAFGNASRA